MDQFKEYPPTSRGCTHQVDDSTCSPAWTSLPQVSPRAYNKSTSLLGLPRKGLVEVLSRFHQGQWRTIASLAMPQLLFCSSPLCLSVCPFSLPPCSRKGGLFVHVLTRRAWGVSFGVHYIAILVDSPLRNFFDLQTKSQNGWGRLGMHLVCLQEVYSQVWACSGLWRPLQEVIIGGIPLFYAVLIYLRNPGCPATSCKCCSKCQPYFKDYWLLNK